MARRQIIAEGTYGMVRRGAIIKPTTIARTVQPTPRADVVRLNTGEQVATSEFTQLTIAQQAYLRKFGIDAFNREQARVAGKHIEAHREAETYVQEQAKKQEEWYQKNVVEVGADKEPILRSQFEKLTLEQQKLLKSKGIEGYNLEIETQSPTQIFDTMKTTGHIPENAIFKSYNETTGEFSYSVPDTRKPSEIFTDLKEAGDIPKDALFESYDSKTREIGYTVPTPKEEKGWFASTVDYLKQALRVDEAILTGEIFGIKNPKLERAAAQINKVFEVFAPQVETKLADDPQGFFVETGKVVASYMPLVWVMNWRGMSKEERIINGAIDAVILVTLGLGSGLRNLKAKPVIRAATTAGRAADRMDETLKVLAKTPMDDVVKYGRASSNAQRAIQASKVADGAFLVQLEKVKSLTSGQLRILEKASGVRGLRAAILDIDKARTRLTAAWKPVSTMKLGGKRYIAQMSKVEAAQAKLSKALATFDTKLKPRYKFNTAPEFKGFAVEWRKRILPTFEGGQPVVAPLGSGRGKGVQLAVLEKTVPRLKLQTYYQIGLKPTYRKVAEVVKPVVAPAVKTASKVATVAAVASTVATKAAIAEAVEKKAATISAKVTTQSAVERIVQTATRQAIEGMAIGTPASQVRAMTELNIESMVKALPVTSTKVELQTLPKIKAMTQTSIEIASKLLTQVQAAIKVQAKARAKVKTKVRARVRVRLRIVLPDGTSRPMTEKELAGSVAWKQGFIYKLIYPPYGPKNIMHSRRPFPGVKTLKGADSAYKTIVALDGELPKTIKRDMGIMDIDITTTKAGKPRLAFFADPKQETQYGVIRKPRTRRHIPRKRRQLTPSAMAGG